MMQATARVRKRAALVVLVLAVAGMTTACFPDADSGVPPDPYAAELFRLMNQDRASAGVPALQNGPKLDNLAGTWSWQMSVDNSLHHQDLGALQSSPDYANYYTLGENLFVMTGDITPAQLESAWMNSGQHRDNILNRSFDVVGVGVFRGPDGRLWVTADFGGI
jgi:uncharacterized protein YkwD